VLNIEIMKNVPIERVSRTDLVDIETVSVGSDFKEIGRIAEYVRQIRNPYCFIAGKHIIKARYAEHGPSIEECVRGVLL
jgi:hypothetical protein